MHVLPFGVMLQYYRDDKGFYMDSLWLPLHLLPYGVTFRTRVSTWTACAAPMQCCRMMLSTVLPHGVTFMTRVSTWAACAAPMHLLPYGVTILCYRMVLPYGVTVWLYLHDKGLHMNSLCCAHAVGSGSHLRLQTGISQGLHQEDPAHKAEVQTH